MMFGVFDAKHRLKTSAALGEQGTMRNQCLVARAACPALLLSLLMSGSALAQTAAANAAPATEASKDHPVLDAIVVTADRRNSFSADYLQAGAFRDARVIDTPLTVAVMPKDLLNAQQALTIMDAVRNTAGVSQSQINTVIYSNLAIRGIPVDFASNYRIDGVLPIVNLVEMPIEDKDRVEVLKGAAGLYYGFATPSGIVNLVMSRPTQSPLTVLDLTGNSHGALGAHVDVSRTEGDLGVRVNAGGASLETGVDRTRGDREFLSTTLDWKPIEKLLVQADAEYINKTITEPTEWVIPAAVNGVVTLPPLQDPSKNLGAEWLLSEGHEYNLLGRVKYDFSPAWSASFSAGTSYADVDRRYSSFSGYNLTTGNGTLGVAMTHGRTIRAFIYRGDVAGAFRTGPIDHMLLLGASDYIRENDVPAAARASFTQNLFAPVDIPEQPTPPRLIVSTDHVEDKGVFVFDRATYHEWLQLTVGYRKADYTDISRSGATSPVTYEVKPGTWSYGLMVKPARWASLYGNYVEGLESGGIAPQIANNAGQVLPAALSKQWELGAKVEPLRGLLITGALFKIDRASSYLNPSNVYVEDGRATYKGFEFSATGELTPELSISVSGMKLDAVQESGAASVIGKRIENTARFSGSAFLEYRPAQISGLRLQAGVFRVGSRAVNAVNAAFVPGYTTLDLGVSYATTIHDNSVVFRVYGENVTNKRYWAATGSSLLDENLPATVKFSLSTTF